MDIVIYTTPETLNHKKGIGEPFSHYFWSLAKCPKKFERGDKVFFAVKGQIVGYFVSEDFGTAGERTEITWNKASWRDVKPIPCKHFQGFKYRNW